MTTCSVRYQELTEENIRACPAHAAGRERRIVTAT